ncbi:MAG: DnaJ domain-containing protein [Gammaproteobacteria bacterium]|nr:DnaJ domain-containing protein [Gammaproteobacteria bacterium]
MKNPLIADILSLLNQHPEGITEFQIIKSLDEHIGFENIADDYQLAIFQKHFLVMNALYQLQQQLIEEERIVLDISPLKIHFITGGVQSNNQQLTETTNEKLSEYYLDWSNLKDTNKEDVEKLLENFWKLYINNDNRLDALAILELEENACSDTISLRYRELAAIHHPDKGGDTSSFIRIRQAYETLISNK